MTNAKGHSRRHFADLQGFRGLIRTLSKNTKRIVRVCLNLVASDTLAISEIVDSAWPTCWISQSIYKVAATIEAQRVWCTGYNEAIFLSASSGHLKTWMHTKHHQIKRTLEQVAIEVHIQIFQTFAKGWHETKFEKLMVAASCDNVLFWMVLIVEEKDKSVG